MKKNIIFVIAINLILLSINCTGASIHSTYVPNANTNPTREYATPSVLLKGGFIYHKTYVPGPIGLNTEGNLEGRSCSQSVLHLFSSGNSTIEAAKRAGNITKVAYLDYEQVGIFMGIIYHRFCTIVKGS
ncbi:TRL-like family protein [Leptospira sp. 2 VSF19]|uniref:TRL-like family protein n=1 Tax=Leptospira soteropolitanensis TaxID=2950025 RepID=A0AAW5V9P4_9LEPT|nr:TRL-like family protein [Leptospira soteropolitanensis]MCW7491934.1 TRL-like family protein [Leptospira soteropolitanensis]MCW7499518.1 TRL-like family protein [Leptospira soteropolitanensis]MCW7520891.1 TRL-like family protein [Leptospira soteropolitanensis]MCW7525622.1 TRL-like family protein [Leptospira soteropolitanensis]MCW7529488.1 TRL-like family protein [Leptospira soteropolitanensis]